MTPSWWTVALWTLGSMAIASSSGLDQSRPVDRRPIPPASQSRIQEVFDAYDAGDDLAVERWLMTAGTETHLDYVAQFVSTATAWSRTRAAFALEVLVQRPMRVPDLFEAGRTMVIGRPSPLGNDAVEDRFEVLWHQTALGLAQSVPQVEWQVQYLAAVGPRFEESRSRGVKLDTRLPLAQAFAAGLLCCWTPVSGEVIRQIPKAGRSSTTLDAAISFFERAAGTPSLRAEALVRGARLLYGAGRTEQARSWLEQVPPHADRIVGYVQQLTHGRVLDRLDRAGDAADAYRKALAIEPHAQRAAIGLAAALMRTGAAEEAGRAAADARRMEDAAARLIGEFHRGDLRFVHEWLAEIRRLRR